MPALWQPGTQYNLGDEVEYEGNDYRIIQAHRSQGDWTPPVTPALWGKMQKKAPSSQPSGGNQGYGQPSGNQGYGQQQPQQPPPQYGDHAPQGHGHGHGHGGNDGDSDDDSKKKKLAIAGGLLGGVAAIGAGVFAYKKHEDHKDEREGWEAWKRDAQARTDAFNREGPKGPATWVLVHGKNYHQHAIVVGNEKGNNLYAARAYHDRAILVGKAGNVTRKGAALGYKNDEVETDVYEILIGNQNQLRWVRTSGRLNLGNLGGARPVEGGRENDGTPLYVVRADCKSSTQPGKASEKLDGAFVPYANDEIKVKDYEVLCYA